MKNARSTKKKAEQGDFNEHLFKNVNVPTPLKALYVNDGHVVACLDANGEPWEYRTGQDAGMKYWNKLTLRGRRRKKRSELSDE